MWQGNTSKLWRARRQGNQQPTYPVATVLCFVCQNICVFFFKRFVLALGRVVFLWFLVSLSSHQSHSSALFVFTSATYWPIHLMAKHRAKYGTRQTRPVCGRLFFSIWPSTAFNEVTTKDIGITGREKKEMEEEWRRCRLQTAPNNVYVDISANDQTVHPISHVNRYNWRENIDVLFESIDHALLAMAMHNK